MIIARIDDARRHRLQTTEHFRDETGEAMTEATASNSYRWLQLLAGIICMVMVANLQYGWTYFVDPMDQANHWGREGIQFAFSLFIATETWLVPVESWF